MQRFNFKLDTFIKVIEALAEEKGKKLRCVTKSGSGIRFELLSPGGAEICNMWVIHTEHSKARRIISKGDYKKAAYELNVALDVLLDRLRSAS